MTDERRREVWRRFDAAVSAVLTAERERIERRSYQQGVEELVQREDADGRDVS